MKTLAWQALDLAQKCLSIVLSTKSVIAQSNISKQYFINLVSALIRQPEIV